MLEFVFFIKSCAWPGMSSEYILLYIDIISTIGIY